MNRRLMVLHLLREAGERGVTTSEFLERGCGSRFGGRLFELRELGYVIESERIRPGAYRYTLTRDVEQQTGSSAEPVPSWEELVDAAQAEASGPPEAAAPPLFPSRPSLYDYDPEDEAA